MRAFVQRLSNSSNYPKVMEWGKMISITGGAQLFVQLTSFASGILCIRLLSTQEYALFVLANTMLGTMTMLADSGITNGVMAESGKVWQDRNKLGDVIATGLNLRRQFGLVSLLATMPLLGYLLITHGASWLMMALIILAIIPAFFAAQSDALYAIVPRLHQNIKPLQKNEIEVSLARVILNALLLLVFPYTFIALIANGIPRIYGNHRLKELSIRDANKDGVPDPLVRKAIIKVVSRTLPIVIYHCISGQISIWLISFFGTTNSISQIGALGRMAVGFTVFSSLFSTLVVPRFARLDSNKQQLLKRFLLIQVLTFLISLILLFSIWLFSDQILWVLGKNYYGLNYELMLVGAINCIGLIGGVCSQLVLSRGWFLKPYFLIGLNFSSTVISITFFNVSSLVGVLYFSIAVSIMAYLMDVIYGLISINKIR